MPEKIACQSNKQEWLFKHLGLENDPIQVMQRLLADPEMDSAYHRRRKIGGDEYRALASFVHRLNTQPEMLSQVCQNDEQRYRLRQFVQEVRFHWADPNDPPKDHWANSLTRNLNNMQITSKDWQNWTNSI